MMKVLVTGATGMIGSHCLPFLLDSGYEVHAVTSKATSPAESQIVWHQVDLLQVTQSVALLERVRPTHLLHFAWVTEPGLCWTDMKNVHWTQASLDMLSAFVHHGGQRAVIAGTCAEYDWRFGTCSESATPLRPATLYGLSKHTLQTAIALLAEQTGLSTAWGRIFHSYGPGEHPQRLIASVVRALLQDQPANCSHGRQLRDWLYVEDVANAFVTLLNSQVCGAVNIASGIPLSVREVVGQLADKLQRPNLVQFGKIPMPEIEPHLLAAEVDRLTDEVRWQPRYNLSVGLDKTIAWWNKLLKMQQ